MKTPHALGLILLAVLTTVAIEESRIAKLRSEIQPAAGSSVRTASVSATPSAGDPNPASTRPSKTERKPKPATPDADPDSEDGDFSKTVRKMWENPAGKAMMNQGVKIAVAMMYEDFIRSLGLTPDETDYMKDLLGKEIADQQELGMKFMSATPEERTALQAEMEKRKADNEAAVKTFLNDEEDYKSYTAYKDRLPERQQLEGIRAVMTGKNAPLDADTESRLIDAMYDARVKMDAPDYSGPKAFEELAKGNVVENFEQGWQKQDERLAAATRDILNEAQQAAFKEYREQAKEMQLMGIKMAEKMMADQKDGKK
jgi:hypothetical protein